MLTTKDVIPLITLKSQLVENIVLQQEIFDEDEEVSTNSEDIDGFYEIIQSFNGSLKPSDISRYSEDLLRDLNESLNASLLSMLPNYAILPTGNEHGTFLAIDLGGSTLRIAIIDITPKSLDDDDRSRRINIIIEKKWIIPNTEKVMNDNFFKFIGSKILETINLQSVITRNDMINVGITWSFPLDTLSHNSALLSNAGKGWLISPETHNQDLKQILEKSVANHFNLNVKVQAIINDSLAVYAAGSFLSSDLKLAMVLGTGFNVCCSLKTDQFPVHKTLNQSTVLINSETSLFGRNLLPLATEFDFTIDNRFDIDRIFKCHMRLDPHDQTIFQPSELMTSGRYLPELTRLVILKLMEMNDLFTNLQIHSSNKLFVKYDGFSNELLCMMLENTVSMDLIKQQFIQEFGSAFINVKTSDLVKIQKVIYSIIERASYIVSIAIVSFIKLLKEHNNETFPNKKLVIGYVGSILVYFNSYRDRILQFVNENGWIKQLEIDVELMSIDDSSIVGAAIGAAYYS